MNAALRPPFPRTTPLAACLAIALAIGSTSMPVLAANRVVQNCGDGGMGSGSLRDMVGVANSGDTIDLSQLPTKCALTDAVITLMNGEIVMSQKDLTLQGPYAGTGTVAISGNYTSRAFNHTGSGQLQILGLVVEEGYLRADHSELGGCITSNGEVLISNSTVTNCTAVSNLDFAWGGGVFAAGTVTLVNSEVSNNNVTAYSSGVGGGIAASEGVIAKYSTISGNNAGGGLSSVGGGAAVVDSSASVGAVIRNSTIEGNSSGGDGGGLMIRGGNATIENSTISYNTSLMGSGGGVQGSGPETISNSTISFNHAVSAGGINQCCDISSLVLQSSIIANNTDDTSVAADLYMHAGSILSGGNSLVTSTNINGAGVIVSTSDPKLAPLQFNGGLTRTHALLPGSPAIGNGNNAAGLATDQRGYPRTTGPNASVDIGAFQFDSIFVDAFEK